MLTRSHHKPFQQFTSHVGARVPRKIFITKLKCRYGYHRCKYPRALHVGTVLISQHKDLTSTRLVAFQFEFEMQIDADF